MNKFFKDSSLYSAWAVTLIAMIGSLYFSDVEGFAPCVLCWYQRVALYPLALLIPAGILMKDKNLPNYSLVLTIAGLAVSLYHNLLYYKVLPETISPCTDGVSCTTKYVEYFGFIAIPLLSFIALATITTLMVVHKKTNHA